VSTRMMSTALARTGMRLAGSGLVPLLLVLGLLMAPVSCTCGTSIPHGHSLFQLPHHHHGAAEYGDSHDHGEHHAPARTHDGFAHQLHPLMNIDPECDELQSEVIFPDSFAFSNMMEQQDSWVVKAPPSSSVGQPMAMSQASQITTPSAHTCNSIDLPRTRTLQGLETSPETPPPRA
jgi:hypothetical protein